MELSIVYFWQPIAKIITNMNLPLVTGTAGYNETLHVCILCGVGFRHYMPTTITTTTALFPDAPVNLNFCNSCLDALQKVVFRQQDIDRL